MFYKAAVGALIIASSIALSATGSRVPEGWSLWGSDLSSYEIGTQNKGNRKEGNIAYLRANNDEPKGFGTIMQQFSSQNYVNQRVRFSANIRTENVKRWAGMWMRADKQVGIPSPVAFDNMQDRPIKGSTDWKNHEVVLDIPAESKSISIGILLDGAGTVWVDNVKLEIVDENVQVTAKAITNLLSEKPVNLEFNAN